MRKIGAGIAVHQHDLSLIQFRFEFWFGLKAVTGVEQCREMWIDAFERAKLPVEKFADHFSEPGVILREARRVNGVAAAPRGKHIVQQVHLRAFAAAVDALEGDETAERPSVKG